MSTSTNGAGPIARSIIERDHAVLSPSYTRDYPLVIDRAQGSEVWDVDGRRYIDFMAGIAVMNVGHRHPEVVAAVKEQVDRFWHICLSDFYYPQAVELAERLQEIAPFSGEARVYFGNSGTEAVEAAVKLAMYHTGRNHFIGFRGGFHGRTLGSLAFTSSKYVQRSRYQIGLKVQHLPYPDPYRQLLTTLDGELYGEAVIRHLEHDLFTTMFSPKEVAAVVVEPIQGEGGYVVPAPGFFPRLRQLCDEHGILLIVDEVQSGVARTGKWWGIQHEGVQPDIVCFAKGVSSGMPIGGILARKAVMDWAPGAHGSTFGGNPVAAVSALATLNVIEKEGLNERATTMGQHIMDALCEIQMRHPSLGDVRGRGMMIGAEIVHSKQSKKRAPELRDAIIRKAFEKGLLLLPCGRNTVRFAPALNIPEPYVEDGLRLFEAALTEAETDYFRD
jgi:4-aminobutyrate aminotransferase